MIYVAGPYSHPDPAVQVERFNKLTAYAASLVLQGHIVYSPITHSHPMDLAMKAQGVASYGWLAFDEHFMKNCTEMRILCLPGWEQSKGVAFEIAWFEERDLPITYVEDGQ